MCAWLATCSRVTYARCTDWILVVVDVEFAFLAAAVPHNQLYVHLAWRMPVAI